LLLIVILVEGYRRDSTEALLAAFPILLLTYGTFGTYLRRAFHIPNTFFPFGLGIEVPVIVSILLVLVVAVLSLRRFLRTQVRDSLVHEAARKDLEQAQQLQQRVLVPDTPDASSPSNPSTAPPSPSAATSTKPSPNPTAPSSSSSATSPAKASAPPCSLPSS
jgi:L-lactate permease